MKKLLAAVTSIAMSASFVSSAFATSVTVSAAGGSSTAQPNVSMGAVMDGAVNKIAGESGDFPVASDFTVSAKDYTAKPGDTITVEFVVSNPNKHDGSQFACEMGDLPAGITAEMTDFTCLAVDPDGITDYYEFVGGKSYQATVLDSNSAPVPVADGEVIVKYELTIPKDIKPGTYEYGLQKFRVIEYASEKAGPQISKFDATLKSGTITIEGDAPTTTAPVPTTTSPTTNPVTTAPVTPTTTTTAQGGDSEFPIADDFTVSMKQDYEVEPGDTITVQFVVSNPNAHFGSQFACEMGDLPAGITAEMTDFTCLAVDPDGITDYYEFVGGKSYQATVLDAESAPVPITDGAVIAQYEVTVPADIAPGEYEIGLQKFRVIEYATPKAGPQISKFDAKLVGGKIIVKGDPKVTTAPSTTPVTTAASTTPVTTASTTPVTTAANTTPVNPAEGKAEWLIPTVKAKPGDTVTMEVIVNGASDLAVAGASYTVTAASPIAFDGVNEQSAAYGSAIVNNADTNEFAFGEGIGKGITASDKAVIMTLTYKVPAGTPGGTYDVKWSDAFISDTNGFEVTNNVTLTDGAIIVEDEKFDGEIEWDIPDKVKAKPGDTVTMEVKVKDPKGAGLPVAGAQFAISAETPVEFDTVSGTSAAYGSAIVNNTDTNEFAFGEGIGKGVKANDGDTVLVLTYKVPEGTPGGEYEVTWGGDIYISDTNGNALTEQISLSNGSILVEDEKFDGDISWDIADKVPAKPGETVKVPVSVKVGDKNLPVAGAQFGINAQTPITFSSVDGTSAAYSAAIVNNAETSEFAFSTADGKGIEAADGSNVLMLEYTVPAGTPAGEYAVTWGGEVYISDTNGNELTAQITLLDGSILVEEEKFEGDIAWDIADKVPGKPGETVKVPVSVKVGDKNLPVAGAQFGIDVKTPIKFSSVDGTSAAYSAAIVNNADTNEFAFSTADGKGVEAADGSYVLMLEYTIPDGTPAGEYEVTWGGDVYISDTNGNELTSQITLLDGSIIIEEVTTTAPVTTAATTVASTAAPTTAASTAVPTTAASTAAPTTAASTAAPTTAASTAAPTTTAAPVTTIPATAPDGKIIWQIDEVDAVPGEEVTLNVVVNDSKGANLPIGGAQYIITETTPIEFVSASEQSAGYSAEIVYNTDTKEFAFANADGKGVAAADGAVVMTLTYKVPEDCADGRYPVTFGDTSFFNISSADGLDMSSQILTVDGAINVKRPATTTSAPVTTAATTQSTAAPTTTAAPVTTTPITAADGSVIWRGETVTAHPGEKVEVSFIVDDQKNSQLPVGGASFVIGVDGGIKLTGGTGSEGYEANVTGDSTTGEYAFAHPKGVGVAAPDGSKVITLTFDVPADTAFGKYPVTLTSLDVSDTNGLDITKNILVINGAIEIVAPTTTAATTAATTATPTTAPVTTVTAPVTTTPTPDGAVIWQLDEVEGKPGETVTLTMTILDPNDTKLAIGGGQFVIVTDPDLVAAAGTPYGANLVYNPETNEFAFADANGNGVPSANGTTMLTIDFTIPADATPGTVYDVEISDLVAINGSGDDVTDSVFGMNGKIKVIAPDTTAPVTTPTTTAGPTPTTTAGPTPTTTAGPTPTTTAGPTPTTTAGPTPTTTAEPTPTTTAPVTTVVTTTDPSGVLPGQSTASQPVTTTNPSGVDVPIDPEVSVTVIDGFYFSHDPKPFNTGHITSIKMTTEDGAEFTPDMSRITFKEVNSGADNPMGAYNKENTDFTYKVNVFYNEQQLIDSATKEPVQITVYIGVKGDANLDNKADSRDASLVLTYYSLVSTGNDPATTMLNDPDPELDDRFEKNPRLDDFGAFLVDVDKDVYDDDNWRTPKGDTRRIMADDASWVLGYYSLTSTGWKENDAWNSVFDGDGVTENSRAYLLNQYAPEYYNVDGTTKSE